MVLIKDDLAGPGVDSTRGVLPLVGGLRPIGLCFANPKLLPVSLEEVVEGHRACQLDLRSATNTPCFIALYRTGEGKILKLDNHDWTIEQVILSVGPKKVLGGPHHRSAQRERDEISLLFGNYLYTSLYQDLF